MPFLHDFASFVLSYRGKGDGIAKRPGPLFGGVPARTQASVNTDHLKQKG